MNTQNVLATAGKALVDACHGAAFTAGWWIDPRTAFNYRDEVRANTRYGKALVAEKLALVHTEVSEALEGHRKSKMDDHLPHRLSIEVELADAVIRIADLGGAVAEKMAYNQVRPDHKPEARSAAGGKAY